MRGGWRSQTPTWRTRPDFGGIGDSPFLSEAAMIRNFWAALRKSKVIAEMSVSQGNGVEVARRSVWCCLSENRTSRRGLPATPLMTTLWMAAHGRSMRVGGVSSRAQPRICRSLLLGLSYGWRIPIDWNTENVGPSPARVRAAADLPLDGTVKANRYRRFSASNPAEPGGNS